jgi:hypothetical protein
MCTHVDMRAHSNQRCYLRAIAPFTNNASLRINSSNERMDARSLRRCAFASAADCSQLALVFRR